MPTRRTTASILFADIVGFSKIRDDALVLLVQNHLSEFLERQRTLPSLFHAKTWGDGLLIAFTDPHDALECALRLRDWIRNYNWRRRGLQAALAIRVGLHVAPITVVEDESSAAIEISGHSVSLAARIEPVAEPNSILCSQAFYLLVQDDATDFVTFRDLGVRQLAKQFGPADLLEVMAGPAPAAQAPSEPKKPRTVGLPRIRKEFGDAEKENHLRQGFAAIREEFQSFVALASESDPDLSVRLDNPSPTKFTCQAFVKGDRKAECQVWIADSPYDHGIHFSFTIRSRDDSHNESLSVWSDGYALYLRPIGLLLGTQTREGLSHADAARYLWDAFVKPLG